MILTKQMLTEMVKEVMEEQMEEMPKFRPEKAAKLNKQSAKKTAASRMPLKALIARLEDEGYGELDPGKRLKEADPFLVVCHWVGNHAGAQVETVPDLEAIKELAQGALDHSGLDYGNYQIEVYDRASGRTNPYKVVIDSISLK